jgi:serine/threonine protein kinase
MALEGKTLGRYQIVRLLGSGGMGDVYLAQDPRIGQQVAIKVIRAEQSPYLNTPEFQEAARLFQREARAIVKLDHPHILPLNDYGESRLGEQALIYLVMPYRPEGSLVRWGQQHYPDRLVPPDVVAHILHQAAQAIQHAHDHQVIHQDVKPSNFLLRERKEDPSHPDVLLADFGIARLATTTASISQAIRGTPTYMAPEQCVGEAVPASDQYALAVMAYELLTGRPPFQGNSMRIMYQHVNTPPEPPSKLSPHLSKELDDVIVTALSKRPEERFRSVTAFANAFQNAMQQIEAARAETRISAAPAPKITSILPDTPLIDATLAEAPTRITPSAEDVVLRPSGPIALTPAAVVREDPLAPGTQGWATEDTGPTAPPLPETLSLGVSDEPGSSDEAEGPPRSGPVTVPMPAPSGPIAPSGRQRTSKRRFILIAVSVLVVLALVAGGVAYAVPGLLPLFSRGATSGPGASSSAMVTIIPASKNLSNTFTLSGVTGTPDASKQQVGARLLSATTSAHSQTVNTTGQGTTPGTQASGLVALFNFQSSPMGFNAGSVWPNNASCERPMRPIDMVLDQTVTVPAAPQPGGYSSAVIAGHILEVGTIGNIPEISAGCYTFASLWGGATCDQVDQPNPCWIVDSVSDFTGGQDPQTYPAVAQSDINNAASDLESANKPNPQQVLQSQIKPNEQLVGTPQCTPKVSSDHQAGDQATQVTVTVTFTCTGEVYDHDGALMMATNLLMQQATADPGAGYVLVGKIKAAITTATLGNQGTVTITTTAEGLWAYQFTQAQQQALARLIAGKSKAEAQQLLTTQTGVASATIQLSGGNGQTLPSDPSKIRIVVQAVSGA